MTPPRKLYTISQKLAMVKTFQKEQSENNKSLCQVARELQIDPSQLRRWAKQADVIEERKKKRWMNHAAKTVHLGCKSCLEHVEENLLWFVLENREQGNAVSIRKVVNRASQLDAAFRHKSERAQDQVIH